VTTATTRRRNARLLRWGVLLIVGLVFAIPLYSMFRYSTRITPQNPSTWDSWRAIVQDSQLRGAILTSLKLAALTVLGMLVLLVPTMIWIRIKVPWANRLVEFLCLLPLTIPAIVLVVGIAPIYAWVTYFFGDSPLVLTFVYIILVLLFAYRAIDAGLGAIDIVTLAEAARSLGSSWLQVLTRVVIPNIRGAIISASVVSVALVLGEFTIASLLNFDTMQVVINLLGKRDAALAVAVSVAALLFAFVLLLVLAYVAPRRRAGVVEEPAVSTVSTVEGSPS